jgi:hypothetical protein
VVGKLSARVIQERLQIIAERLLPESHAMRLQVEGMRLL